jgi:hypothetical protein
VLDDLTDEVPQVPRAKTTSSARRARGKPRAQAKGSRQPRSDPASSRRSPRRPVRHPEEQEQLARYVGWGGLKNVFPDPAAGNYGKGFEDVGAELASS